MSLVALQLRLLRSKKVFEYSRLPFLSVTVLSLFIISSSPSDATEHDDVWRYWRPGGVKSYPAQTTLESIAPPMPTRKSYYDAHDYVVSEPSIAYDERPRRKKKKRHYKEPVYEELPDHEDDHDEADYGDEVDHGDYAANDDHHANGQGFGRLFPGAGEDEKDSVRHLSFRRLRALGRSMVEESRDGHPSGDSEQPAGYTFFGQFIDHDITFETTTDLGREITGDHLLENARTPDLDLDSVYGGGPKRTPHLFNLPYIRVGRLISEDGETPRFDLFRTRASYSDGPAGGRAIALLGDPRNDENIIISQLHAAFVAFHNRTVDILVQREYGRDRHEYCEYEHECSTQELALALPGKTKTEIFERARDHVVHYYHRLIVEDFLPRTIGLRHTISLLKKPRNFFFPDGFRGKHDDVKAPYIPLEFSFAFRYGHSQVRDEYILRDRVRFNLLSDGEDGSPRAFEPVRPRHLVDWRYFFEIDGKKPYGFNFARKIDPKLVRSLHELQFSNAVERSELGSLAARNLARSKTQHIPSGQKVAKLILPELEERGLFGYSKDDEHSRDHRDLWKAFLLEPDRRVEHFLGEAETPLWYYVVQEAATFGTPTYLKASPYGDDGDHRYSSDYDRDDRYDRHVRPVSFRYGDDHYEDEHGDVDGGHRLGPVGAAIVGEVLTGLVESYAVKTGKGLGYRPEIKGSLSILESADHEEKGRKRYLMRNFLIDAGVTGEDY